MITVEITCDHVDHPRAREGKPSNWCLSRSNSLPPLGDNPAGEHTNIDTACSKARNAARMAGWKQTKINPMGQRGWLCPNCYARAYEGA